MPQLSVAAVGQDRPGIVAAVTKVLYELGCNLADCSMSRLSGQFAMIMLLDSPEEVGLGDLSRSLADPSQEVGITVSVMEVAPAQDTPPSHPYVISVFGADHPGIVYRVTSELAGAGVNITNLVSRISGQGIYTVVLDIDIPDEVEPQDLAGRLYGVAEHEGVDLHLRSADIDTL